MTGKSTRRYKAMNPEFKAKWVLALESGKYKQTDQALYNGEGYCCLGVLCKVSRLTAKKYVTEGEAGSSNSCTDFDKACYLSAEGQKVAGLSTKVQKLLSRANDDKGWDFKKIAAWVKKNL